MRAIIKDGGGYERGTLKEKDEKGKIVNKRSEVAESGNLKEWRDQDRWLLYISSRDLGSLILKHIVQSLSLSRIVFLLLKRISELLKKGKRSQTLKIDEEQGFVDP